jgi:hypothetical protein
VPRLPRPVVLRPRDRVGQVEKRLDPLDRQRRIERGQQFERGVDVGLVEDPRELLLDTRLDEREAARVGSDDVRPIRQIVGEGPGLPLAGGPGLRFFSWGL